MYIVLDEKNRRAVLVCKHGTGWTATATTDPNAANKRYSLEQFNEDIRPNDATLAEQVDKAFETARTFSARAPVPNKSTAHRVTKGLTPSVVIHSKITHVHVSA